MTRNEVLVLYPRLLNRRESPLLPRASARGPRPPCSQVPGLGPPGQRPRDMPPSPYLGGCAGRGPGARAAAAGTAGRPARARCSGTGRLRGGDRLPRPHSRASQPHTRPQNLPQHRPHITLHISPEPPPASPQNSTPYISPEPPPASPQNSTPHTSPLSLAPRTSLPGLGWLSL